MLDEFIIRFFISLEIIQGGFSAWSYAGLFNFIFFFICQVSTFLPHLGTCVCVCVFRSRYNFERNMWEREAATRQMSEHPRKRSRALEIGDNEFNAIGQIQRVVES